jgi:hypothetical protein
MDINPFQRVLAFSPRFIAGLLDLSQGIYRRASPKQDSMQELSIIQKTHDFIKWYIPILNRLPRNHRFHLGPRIINRIYELLEGLIESKFANNKLPKLESLNVSLSF